MRPRSRTTYGMPAPRRPWLRLSPAQPAPMTTTSRLSLTSNPHELYLHHSSLRANPVWENANPVGRMLERSGHNRQPFMCRRAGNVSSSQPSLRGTPDCLDQARCWPRTAPGRKADDCHRRHDPCLTLTTPQLYPSLRSRFGRKATIGGGGLEICPQVHDFAWTHWPAWC
jgi:hypothetical protein